MQISVLVAATSCFFRGRSQLDDLIFRGLADDVFTVEARVGTGKESQITTKVDLIHNCSSQLNTNQAFIK